MAEKVIHTDDPAQRSELFGQYDGNISRIQKEYGVSVVNRQGDIKVIGEEPGVSAAAKALEQEA